MERLGGLKSRVKDLKTEEVKTGHKSMWSYLFFFSSFG